MIILHKPLAVRSSLFFLIVLLFPLMLAAQRNDSLWKTWNNISLHDTLRLQAIQELAWEGYGYSKPDSAYYLAGLMHDYAQRKQLHEYVAKALLIQGNTMVIQGKYVKAYDRYRQSLEMSEKAGDKPDIAVALHRIGIIYYYQGDIPKAIDYYMRSLKLREEINDMHGISATVNNLGIVYSEQGMYDKALEYFTRSLEIAKASGDKRGEASALNNMGLVYKSTGEAARAYYHYKASLEISDSLKDFRDVAAALNNIGHIYELRNDYDKALKSFSESVEIKRTIQDKQGLATSLVNIGYIYQKQNDYKTAVLKCEEAFATAKEVGALAEQNKACQCLYIGYKKLNRQDKALFYHEKMLQLNDSIRKEETARLLQHMEFARQVMEDSLSRAAEKAKMEELHREEIRNKNQTRNVLIVSTIVLLAGAGALYSRMAYIRRSRTTIANEKDQSEKLLLNILPKEIAEELKLNGEAAPRKFENVSILFTDFQEFTKIASAMSPENLVAELNECFRTFDRICQKHGIEKIKTVGDSFMAAGGLPRHTRESTRNTLLAAIEMSEFMLQRQSDCGITKKPCFEMRAGVHTGTVVAGIVGLHKWQYDVWGDTVNTASRIEQAGVAGKVNISRSTYELVKDDPQFIFEPRGGLMVKGKGSTEMYFVERAGD